MNYSGHGSVDLWRGNLLTAQDVSLLSNTGRLSIFLLMTCLNGYFHDPGLDSLAESLLKAENRGAVAVWASSGMTDPGSQAAVNQEMIKVMFGGPTTLGEAVAKAKASPGNQDIRRTWILFGDPALPIGSSKSQTPKADIQKEQHR